jgi:hypothetical protein
VTDIEQVRGFALSLPEACEEPHFEMTSFRVKGKIFATVPPDQTRLHVFVDEASAEASVAEDPAAFELLRWGQRVAGVRVRLDAADPNRVRELLADSWRRRAPRRLVTGYDRSRPA